MKCVKRNERAGERGLNSGARKALKFRRGMRMRENGERDRRECAKGWSGPIKWAASRYLSWPAMRLSRTSL